MAHFIGVVKGNRGEASCLGTYRSGVEASAQGWHIGGRVRCYVGEDGRDRVTVEVTGGSGGPRVYMALHYVLGPNGPEREV